VGSPLFLKDAGASAQEHSVSERRGSSREHTTPPVFRMVLEAARGFA